jgi:hypothetical protein
MSEQDEKKLKLGKPPTYPFGVDDDFFKKLKPDDFEIYDEEKPFEFVILTPDGMFDSEYSAFCAKSGRATWQINAHISVLAHSGYDAIKLVAKICPGYTYRFADCHFDCQRKALEALWHYTEMDDKTAGRREWTGKFDLKVYHAIRNSPTLDDFIAKLKEANND